MEIELPDGTVLDAPDNADPSVVAKAYLSKQSAARQVTSLQRAEAGAAGFNSGVAGILGIPVDTGQNIVDLGKAAAGSAYTAFTGKAPPNALMIQSRANLPMSSEWIRNRLNDAGGAATIPRPDDTASRYLAAAGSGAASAMLGPSTGTAMLPSLATNVGGAVSSQFAAEQGASPGTQIAAGMVGGALANGARYGIAEGVKRSFRGGEEGRMRTAENINAFEDAGTTPSAGQATQSRMVQAAESLLSKAPGGAGVMSKKGTAQAAEIGASLEDQAAKLAPGSSAEQAGRAITRGIKGEGGFIDQFKAKQEALYQAVDKNIPANTQVAVPNTQKALADLNADIPNAPNISKFFKNAKIQGIDKALSADTTTNGGLLQQLGIGNGTLPYQALSKLRTLVGREMADSSILSDVPRSKWKALYGALSSDMETAATSAGPAASQAWQRANNFTRAGMRRLETIDHVVDANGGPEAIFSAATSGTKEGATTLRAVMQSLPEEGQKTLSATVLRRLGKATPGQQNAVGGKFSTETFLTNWNSMSAQAKAALFDRYGPEFRQNMDQVAKVASNLRDGSKVFQNPSGTGQATTQIATATAFIMSALRGDLGTAGAIAGGVTGANLSARLLTHPPFVKWLAKTTKAPPQALPILAAQLAQNGNADEKAFAAQLQQNGNQGNN